MCRWGWCNIACWQCMDYQDASPYISNEKEVNWFLHMFCTEKEREGMVFKDESCLHVINCAGKMMWYQCRENRFDCKYTIKKVKHAAYTMVWNYFNGHGGRGALAFLCRNTTMNGEQGTVRSWGIIRYHLRRLWEYGYSCMMVPHAIEE